MELSVKTSTGKEFSVDHCASAIIGLQSLLYIEFVGYSMTEIFEVFSNKDETATIYGLVAGSVEKIYNGYTKLAEIFIVPQSTNIRIRLEPETIIDILGQ